MKRFIVALDQSGGSTERTLSNYGIEDFDNKEELMHELRKRIIKSKYFTSDKICGVILPQYEVEKEIDNDNIVKYLSKKNIPVFVKIDEGLSTEKDGTRLMKKIGNLEEKLDYLKKNGVYGTKMRSLIIQDDEDGIKKVVVQNILLAKKIFSKGLIPIVEPEVSINSNFKSKCENILAKTLLEGLKDLNEEKIILKLTLPDIDNTYESLIGNDNVLKVVALSGGYSKKESIRRLFKNKGMVACFSRAFLEDLKVYQNDEEFDMCLKKTINEIYGDKDEKNN